MGAQTCRPTYAGISCCCCGTHDRGEGLVARDQMGARSLFLYDAGGVLYFASEIHQLLALLPRRPEPDPISVAHWLSMSSAPGSATLYAGIRRLNPGSLLALSGDGVREERYWAPRFVEPSGEPPEHLAVQHAPSARTCGRSGGSAAPGPPRC